MSAQAVTIWNALLHDVKSLVLGPTPYPSGLSDTNTLEIEDPLSHLPPSPSVFDSLPNEILAEIFIYCLRDVELAKPHRNYSPLLPCSVCRRWREVTLGCPNLWAQVAVHVTQYTVSPSPRRFNKWITRSGASPLSIMVHVHLAEFGPLNQTHRTYHDATLLLGILIKQSARLRQLILFIPASLQSAIMDLQSSVPLLERLDLLVDYPSDWETGAPKLEMSNILLNAPRLRELGWLAGGSLSSEISHSWSRLTKLHIEFTVTLSQCYAVLRICPLLVSCRFGSIPLEGERDYMMPLQHHHLHSFAINGPIDPRLLLAHITTPALRSLHLTHSSERSIPPNSNDVLPEFIVRSACPLEELVVENAALQEEELYRILVAVTKSLVKLDIWDDCETATPIIHPSWQTWQQADRVSSCISNRVLMALTFPRDGGPILIDNAVGRRSLTFPLCPKLQVFKYRGAISAPDGMLATMLKSRWSSPSVANGIVTELQAVLLEFNANRPMDTAQLNQLRSSGLHCRVFVR